MPYLLDADVFITAKRSHYRTAVCPGFWDWVIRAHGAGVVFSVREVREELLAGRDALASWAAALPPGFFLQPDTRVAAVLPTVSNWPQTRPYAAQAVADFFDAADYWLVAHALAGGHVVVTHEVPDPACKRRVKIPDVCAGLGVNWMSPFDMLEAEAARFVL